MRVRWLQIETIVIILYALMILHFFLVIEWLGPVFFAVDLSLFSRHYLARDSG
jgi:hypothetical protein